MCKTSFSFFTLQMVFINNKTSMVDIPGEEDEEGLAATLACFMDVVEETVGVREVTTGALLREEAVLVRNVGVLSRLKTDSIQQATN